MFIKYNKKNKTNYRRSNPQEILQQNEELNKKVLYTLLFIFIIYLYNIM